MGERSSDSSSRNGLRLDCAGCDIIRGDIEVPGGVIYAGNAVVLAADTEMPIPGFLTVTAKRHVRSLSELTNKECHELIDVVFYAEKALKSLGITEVTLVQEERSSHLHFWIFPNYDWMTEKFGKGITYLRAISEYAKETSTNDNEDEVLSVVEKVRGYFKDCPIKVAHPQPLS